MKKAQEMQTKMAQLKDLGSMMVVKAALALSATSTARRTGADIDPSIFDPNEKVVEDLILAAIKRRRPKPQKAKRWASCRRPPGTGMKLPF